MGNGEMSGLCCIYIYTEDDLSDGQTEDNMRAGRGSDVRFGSRAQTNANEGPR